MSPSTDSTVDEDDESTLFDDTFLFDDGWPAERADAAHAFVNEYMRSTLILRLDYTHFSPDPAMTGGPIDHPWSGDVPERPPPPPPPPNTPAPTSPNETPIPSASTSPVTSRNVSPERGQANTKNEDAGDESLQRYKESLGLGGGGKDLSNPNDPRVCIIESLSLESPNRSPVTIDLSAPGSETTLKDKPFKIKEGVKFTMVAKFRVQHEILSGLQYVQVVKRKGIRVSKDSEMMGSYAPNTDKTPLYSKRFQEEDAPSGMLARGHYNAVSSFVDDDKKTHLTFEWSFDIAKDW